MNKKDEIICNTVFISFICYYFFILFLALRNIGKNIYIYIYIYIFPTAKSALLLFIYIYIFSHLLSRALIWLGHFRLFWIISFEFVKVCWIRFSSWESFIGFSIWCYPISSILARLFIICENWLCWKGSIAAEMPSRASYPVYCILWRLNLRKLSRKLGE